MEYNNITTRAIGTSLYSTVNILVAGRPFSISYNGGSGITIYSTDKSGHPIGFGKHFRTINKAIEAYKRPEMKAALTLLSTEFI
jgi:hypothetical protein